METMRADEFIRLLVAYLLYTMNGLGVRKIKMKKDLALQNLRVYSQENGGQPMWDTYVLSGRERHIHTFTCSEL